MGHVYGFLLNADERLELLTNTVGQTDACREFFDGVCKANVNGKKKTTLVTTKNDNQSKTRLKESAEPKWSQTAEKGSKTGKVAFFTSLYFA